MEDEKDQILADINKEIMLDEVKKVTIENRGTIDSAISPEKAACTKLLGIGLSKGHNPDQEIVSKQLEEGSSRIKVKAPKPSAGEKKYLKNLTNLKHDQKR